jgi:hypothetical protein
MRATCPFHGALRRRRQIALAVRSDRIMRLAARAGPPTGAEKFSARRVDPEAGRSSCGQGGREAAPGKRENKETKAMRVMVMVKATKDSEAGLMPSSELLEAMGRYNEELAKAGIMLSGDGLKPSSQGKRIAFDGPRRTVIDGPFAETRELVAGFWMWEVRDMAEAVEWVKRCPNPMPGPSEIEIRPFYELTDFGEALTPEGVAVHERVREQIKQR